MAESEQATLVPTSSVPTTARRVPLAADLYDRIRMFLASELGRGQGRQCVRVSLSMAAPEHRDMPLFERVREDTPNEFELSRVDELAGKIIQAAEEHVDSLGELAPRGGVRFVCRTHQALGMSNNKFFVIASYAHEAGGGMNPGNFTPDATGMIAQQMSHNDKLMERNQKMAEGTIGLLLRTQQANLDEIVELKSKLRAAEDKIKELSDESDVRMMQALSQQSADKRKDALAGKLLQLSPILAAKFLGKGDAGGAGTGLALMIVQLRSSMPPEQFGRIAQHLKQEQILLLVQIFDTASGMVPPEEKIGASAEGQGG